MAIGKLLRHKSLPMATQKAAFHDVKCGLLQCALFQCVTGIASLWAQKPVTAPLAE